MGPIAVAVVEVALNRARKNTQLSLTLTSLIWKLVKVLTFTFSTLSNAFLTSSSKLLMSDEPGAGVESMVIENGSDTPLEDTVPALVRL
jgi:hypothetical protein